MAIVEKLPLAVCDARTVMDKPRYSGLNQMVIFRDEWGQGSHFHPKQRWCYFPDMTIDEALALKTWDADKGLPHWQRIQHF